MLVYRGTRPWGLEELDGTYFFAMGYGAALMAGRTGLLAWSHEKPVERRPIALLTMQVIPGFVATEIWAVREGVMPAGKLLPTWMMQSVLTGLFGYGYWRTRAHRDEARDD